MTRMAPLINHLFVWPLLMSVFDSTSRYRKIKFKIPFNTFSEEQKSQLCRSHRRSNLSLENNQKLCLVVEKKEVDKHVQIRLEPKNIFFLVSKYLPTSY